MGLGRAEFLNDRHAFLWEETCRANGAVHSAYGGERRAYADRTVLNDDQMSDIKMVVKALWNLGRAGFNEEYDHVHYLPWH